MTHYRAFLFAVSLAVVTILAALYSPAEGGAAAAHSILLNLSRGDVAHAAGQPAAGQPKERSSKSGAVSPNGKMMKALTDAKPLGGAKPAGDNKGAAVTDTSSQGPAGAGGNVEGDAANQGGAGTGSDSASGGNDAGAGGGGDEGVGSGGTAGGGEGAPIDERKLTQLLAAYHSQLVQLIEGQKHYPVIARKLGHQGFVQLSFTLSNDGRLVASKVSSSSGFAELDESALGALRAVPRFPAFPTQLGPSSRPFVVSLSFNLD
jgi:TonB family protein